MNWWNWILKLLRIAPDVVDTFDNQDASNIAHKGNDIIDANLPDAEAQRAGTAAGAAANHASHIAGPNK